MIVTSKITGIAYDSDSVLYLTDIPQWSFYFQNGCETEILDILYDPSRNQSRPLCMVFKKSKKMHELYDMWLERKKRISETAEAISDAIDEMSKNNGKDTE